MFYLRNPPQCFGSHRHDHFVERVYRFHNTGMNSLPYLAQPHLMIQATCIGIPFGTVNSIICMGAACGEGPVARPRVFACTRS